MSRFELRCGEDDATARRSEVRCREDDAAASRSKLRCGEEDCKLSWCERGRRRVLVVVLIGEIRSALPLGSDFRE